MIADWAVCANWKEGEMNVGVHNYSYFMRVYYSLAVGRFKPILSASLQFHSHLAVYG